MSTRNRNSNNARPSLAQSTANRHDGSLLPPYQKPSYPLSLNAQTRFQMIYNTHNLAKLREQHKVAEKYITESAGQINDVLRERRGMVDRRKAKLARQGEDPDPERTGELELGELEEQVQDATMGLEKGIRSVVDGYAQIQRVQDTVLWVKENALAEGQREYNTQLSQRQTQTQTQSQWRRRGARDGDDDGMLDVDGEMDSDENDQQSSPGPTPLEPIALTGPSEMFENKLKASKEQYFAKSHTARYSRANPYIGFRKVVHDARYGDDGPPLPRPEHWFTESGSPAPGITGLRNENADDDEDLAIARESISTKCPLTLREFTNPVSSSKCPHSFEDHAIRDMIRNSTIYTAANHGTRREKSVECPVGGCDQVITLSDLRPDPILVRKIRRIQQARERAEQEDDEEDEKSEEEGGPTDDRQSQRPPQSSKILDLGVDDSDEEEGDEEEDGNS